MFDRKNRRLWLAGLLVAALALGSFGCGDDDPTDVDDGQVTLDDFDQETAVMQAPLIAAQGANLVASVAELVAGVGQKSWVFNEDEVLWEYTESWIEDGHEFNWFYTVQYFDADGVPQPLAVGSTSVRHTMTGTADYTFVDEDNTVVFDYDYNFDTLISLVETGVYLLDGAGGHTLDVYMTGPGSNGELNFAVNWETLGDGITVPLAGCPTGTIRYTLAPYYLDLVFDGSATATATMYDAAGTEIAAGSSERPLDCAGR